MSSSHATLLALQAPFLYVHATMNKLDLPATTPVAVIRHQHVINLSSAALQAGAALGRPSRALRHAVPNLHVVNYAPEQYEALATALCDFCAELTPIVEPVLPHLVLSDVTGCRLPPIEQVATSLSRNCGTPVCVAVAPTRWVVRCAAAHLAAAVIAAASVNSKSTVRNYWQQVHADDTAAYLAPLPIHYLSVADPPIYIAHSAALVEGLHSFGITNFGELAAVPVAYLSQQFGGKVGLWLHNLAVGIDSTPIRPLYPADKVGVHFWAATESTGLSDVGSIDQVLIHLCTKLAAILSARGKAVRAVSLIVALRSRNLQASREFRHPTLQRQLVLNAVRRLWEALHPTEPVFGILLRGEHLEQPVVNQGSIFVADSGVAEGLNKALRSVESRFGPGALQKATQLPLTRRELVRRLWEGENL